MGGIDYNGRPGFQRPRKLTEVSNLEQFQDKLIENAFQQIDEREEATDQLFSDLAKTYLKGRALLNGLSKMDPAQFIPIEEFADSTRAAAKRLDKEGSKDGEIITYNLYQKAIDLTLAKKWEIRGTVINMRIPASVSQQSVETSKQMSNSKGNNLIEELISQNGIISTIIGMLTISPFQTLIFQTLSSEESAAKGIQTAQIAPGIALFLELGIKAERIISMLKDTNLTTPLVELQIAELSGSETARAAALGTVGIDYEEFKKSQEIQDCAAIMSYVSDYYKRYGGLDRPNGHLSLDHWIAYLQVAQNQQTIRGALNTAHVFSPKFQSIKEHFVKDEPATENIFKEEDKKHSKIFIQLASATRAIRESSNDIYDDIIAAFTTQLTDRELCCLVEIFGAIGNPEIMYTIASLLRILATDLAGEIARLENIFSRYLANLAQDALFEIVADINKYYYKLVEKITKAFTVDFEGLEACGGMFSLGWAVIHAVEVIFRQVSGLIKELSSIIGDFGLDKPGSWEVSADRRELLGIARILEVLAARLDLANTCELDRVNRSVSDQISDSNTNIDQAIFTILGSIPPNLIITEEEKAKYFPNQVNRKSERLKFTYGIVPVQNNNEGTSTGCYTPNQRILIDNLIKNLTEALKKSFNG